MKMPKWTPAKPTQVVNFLIFYVLTMWFWGVVYKVSANPIATWFFTTFSDGFLPLLMYCVGYTLVVQYLFKKRGIQ